MLFVLTEGKKHDSGMLMDSGLLVDLERRVYSTNGQAMCVYGDPAYPLRIHLQAPYRGAQITEQMKLFNKSMSATRVSVEWLFGDIITAISSDSRPPKFEMLDINNCF